MLKRIVSVCMVTILVFSFYGCAQTASDIHVSEMENVMAEHTAIESGEAADIEYVESESAETAMLGEEPRQSEETEPMSDAAEREDTEDIVIVERTPVKGDPHGKLEYDFNDTVYSKEYYTKNFGAAKIMFIRNPDVNLQEELEDYFNVGDYAEGLRILSDMFFDNRSIEMDEEELVLLFYSHGYLLYLHNVEIKGLHVRLVEIQELNDLSLYPSVILIQSWDDGHIYLEDITGPIPRKVRSIFTIDDKENPQMVIHSSGLSEDYIWEEELSFWEFQGTYWALIPMELDVDTSRAHMEGDYYPDLDRDELFPTVYYRDGIVFRTSIQNDTARYTHKFTFRLGKMEEIEKNKIFRLVAIYDLECRPYKSILYGYIQFTIK